MIVRSKAPFRLGLAGGGTDVSPYSDLYGGCILNATISLYAFANIEPRDDNKIVFRIPQTGEEYIFDSAIELPILNDKADLMKGIYNRIVKDYANKPLSFTLTCALEVPFGSGLGTSSTLAVAILGAYTEWLSLPLGEYDLAYLAYLIERVDLMQAGGKQDQYSAAFGGFNFMEFYADDKVIVNPLRVRNEIINELSNNLLLYYTNSSRNSGDIIAKQQKNVKEQKSKSIEAMHQIKNQAYEIKEAILKNNLDEIGHILHRGWNYKREMADGISTPFFEELYETAMSAGSSGGKISGAGGGGYVFFYCPGNSRFEVAKALEKLGGKVQPYSFTKKGLETWHTK
ncbi:D-glycero-alpha-D-manno-heptose-7-phosphate kinase [Dysgonomonas sp. PFB1-18]|uniref:GHMP family kinase ATP-binding protein n=1 Tax=unclassified Dysgonomonas TaxID=2630389 RepID=UPI00247721E2|nr:MULTISPECIES: dehydrogenase [unclassified Dysgonomonas]MDL2303028.1 dehydrogenase [Dysgonomonas sp. OttesenSCG-928-D17]MDH6307789.1 D-glycero-alpha-D-manno-heptose-7-phosphate kinase [Dysgonomonas sp. PF1-14]MDH6337707.1 D-glycero-alpha-D-manno-heptose-7-phosphate kinase [Dysgonomonas sp. PF1-16]MDH6378931.1 D-glycero-alpha-D-manno-heptose-7-phosphate kinase [Dysgonomonas sp. PFB1-18]MDH6396566.1 D-glycero-alpha-D-manno-heptose-7-phosphate kinase [Dysgonomonas sp. PF1-23]